jgi:nitrous oxide reductase accessory protein NosL
VKGSDVNMCAQAHEMIDADKRPADVHYDRCAPSILAFAQEGEAIQFSREHGGTVHSFREVAASYAK